jgi:hypothetical protein
LIRRTDRPSTSGRRARGVVLSPAPVKRSKAWSPKRGVRDGGGGRQQAASVIRRRRDGRGTRPAAPPKDVAWWRDEGRRGAKGATRVCERVVVLIVFEVGRVLITTSFSRSTARKKVLYKRRGEGAPDVFRWPTRRWRWRRRKSTRTRTRPGRSRSRRSAPAGGPEG